MNNKLKISCLAAAFAVAVSGGVWAQSADDGDSVIDWRKVLVPEFRLSAGGGATLGGSWKDATLKEKYRNYDGAQEYGGIITTPDETTQDAMRQGFFNTTESIGHFGLHGFFDATFVEVGAAIRWNPTTQTVDIPDRPKTSPTLNGPETYTYMFTDINIALTLKYPFTLGDQWQVYPLAGGSYQIALCEQDDVLYKSFQKVVAMGYDMPNLGEYWNAFRIFFGAGTDYYLTDNLYIRGEAAWDIKLNNDFENGNAKYWMEEFKGVSQGFKVNLSLAYKFFGTDILSSK